MPLYHFKTEEGKSQEAASLPDADSARSHAVTTALKLLWECPYRLHASPEWSVLVQDHGGNPLFSVSLFDALGQEPNRSQTAP